LIDCGLKTLPSSVFQHCNIQRTEALLLQENELTSLGPGGSFKNNELKVIDLHNNLLEKLPEDFGQLSKLKVLYLQNNKLKLLPTSIGSLKKLETLNLSNNCLKEVPSSISGCTSLKTLDLRNNWKLKRIPKEIGHIQGLESLHLDEEHITYPPQNIAKQGTEAIMRFLCKECDTEYIPPSECLPVSSDIQNGGLTNGHNHQLDPYEDIVKKQLEKLENQKAEKKKQHHAMEQHNAKVQEQEMASRVTSDSHKKKLLNDLADEENKKGADLMVFQKLKDKERDQLFKRLNDAENQADSLIRELSNKRYSDPKELMKTMEKERREMEERFTIDKGDAAKLRETEVLRAMQMNMEEEMQKEFTRRQYEARQEVIQTAMNNSLDNDRAVEEVLKVKGKQQKELISSLLEDEKYQREAFQRLFMKQDARNLEITDHLTKIQIELASLTKVEMRKRDLKVEFEVSVMDEKREALTSLLMNLMEQKKERAVELQERMAEMEERKEDDLDNYWLIQYQKLMEAKPKRLVDRENELDQNIKDILNSCSGEEFLPVFAKKNITMKMLTYMGHKELKEAGVTSEYVRTKIISGVEAILSVASVQNGGPSAPSSSLDPSIPSAPPSEQSEGPTPSAPPAPLETFQSAECVVCMERPCDILFLPCGHLCSCSVCESGIKECPLCRAEVNQKVKLS